jgi:rhodanese-related sulfurtransferase
MAKSLADLVQEALERVEEIAPEEARGLLDLSDRGGWHFVDVREHDEFAAGRIPGARHVPRGFLEVRADLDHPKRDLWLADRSRPLLLYCGGGHRSALAASALLEMGFKQVISLREGWSGWTRRGYPEER